MVNADWLCCVVVNGDWLAVMCSAYIISVLTSQDCGLLSSAEVLASLGINQRGTAAACMLPFHG